MRRLYLRDCQPGDIVEDVYVVTNKQFSASSTGKYFIKAFVSDRSTQVAGRYWNATREVFNALPDNGFARLRGRVENYQNNLQIIIEQFWPAKPGSYDPADLMPHTTKQIGPMCAKLSELMGSIQNRHLAALVHAYLDDEPLMKDFCRAPAAQSFHHAFVGGLLEHTLNAIEVADAIVRFYPTINRDLVLAGLFLHDIAKTWELSYESSFGYTDGGHLVGHLVKSAMWLEAKAKVAEESLGERIPRELIDVLQHIILSHHEKPEFGAARVPATPEALFVALLDNFDAKINIVTAATRGALASGEGNWTEYLKAFGGRFYRPDVAPADAPVDEPSAPAPAPPAATPAPAVATAAPVEMAPVAAEPMVVPEAPALKLTITNPLFESFPPRKK